ncbi:hypothetical protein [Knoellia sinensis]|nr:hypothetical protein [Knoellia sinensis]
MFRVPDSVAYDVIEADSDHGIGSQAGAAETVYLLSLPDGVPLVLSGMGAILWLLAAEGVTDVASAVASATGESVGSIEPLIRDYLESLVADGLLEHRPV